jgi:uncharacterized membrane protein YidH (DUF202 family)
MDSHEALGIVLVILGLARDGITVDNYYNSTFTSSSEFYYTQAILICWFMTLIVFVGVALVVIGATRKRV